MINYMTSSLLSKRTSKWSVEVGVVLTAVHLLDDQIGLAQIDYICEHVIPAVPIESSVCLPATLRASSKLHRVLVGKTAPALYIGTHLLLVTVHLAVRADCERGGWGHCGEASYLVGAIA